MQVKIKKGLNISVAGVPEPILETGNPVRSVAVLGADYVGLKPQMLAKVGDRVTMGQPLFIDKRDPKVMFTAPGGGVVSAINRGARRALQSIVIELDEAEQISAPFSGIPAGDPANIAPDEIRRMLCTSGWWTAFRTRPFNKIPQSDSRPHSIFVTAIDTEPLSGNPDQIIAAQSAAFATGLRTVARLTSGPVWVCTGTDQNNDNDGNEQIRHVKFTGPHPAGLPGTHIHHLDPVGPNRTVWHIGYQDVIAIGKLLGDGQYWMERTVALGGAGFSRTRLLSTRLGANIDDLVAGEFRDPHLPETLRLISGSVLNGRIATGATAFLGRYHRQVSALRNEPNRRTTDGKSRL